MTTAEERSRLKTEIRAAFTGRTCPPVDRIALHECEECAELRTAFAGITWTAVPDSLIELHPNSLPLFAPAAFAYYLPAYLLYALDHFSPDALASEMTVYSVAPDPATEEHANWFRERFKELAPREVAVIETFLALVAADPVFGAHMVDLPDGRARFRDLWETRWSA